MSRFKSEPNRASRERDAGSPPQVDRVEQAVSEGARGSGEIPLDAVTEPSRAATRSGGFTERNGSGRYDPVWIPGAEAPAPEHLPEPPVIELIRHALPEDAPIDPRLAMLREPDSTRAASFRVLRHHIADSGAPQVIAVTSPRDRQRKTTCAINLAIALAESGQAKVLLVDGNRLRPEVGQVLRFVPPRCFLRQIESRRDDPARAWKFVDIPDLGLHVAGIDPETDRRPFIDGPAFTGAFESLRLGGYDHIVVDASSVLRSADLNLLQDAVDAVLLTAVERRTTARELRMAVEQLTPAKILGTTLFES